MHVIRPVEAADRTEWLRMRALLLPDEATHEAEVDEYLSAADPSGVTLVAARIEGGLAGFIEVGTRSYAEDCTSSPVAYIEAWYVDADLRRSGLGRALIEAAVGWARSAGYTEMGSDALADNAGSIAAHLALGFEKAVRPPSPRCSPSGPAGSASARTTSGSSTSARPEDPFARRSTGGSGGRSTLSWAMACSGRWRSAAMSSSTRRSMRRRRRRSGSTAPSSMYRITWSLRVLHPRLEVAVAPDARRACWTVGARGVAELRAKFTEVYFAPEWFVDNSDETPEETAGRLRAALEEA